MRFVTGEVFSLALFYLPFPVQAPLHIWIAPPADKEQGSGWREEGEDGSELGPALPSFLSART